MVGMESLPDAAGPLGLVLLAHVECTARGTLVIPVILLVVGQGGALRIAGRTLLYLAVIGLFYLLLGIALLAGLLPLIESFGYLLASPAVMLALAVSGVLLVVWCASAAGIRRRPPGAGPIAPDGRPGGPVC